MYVSVHTLEYNLTHPPTWPDPRTPSQTPTHLARPPTHLARPPTHPDPHPPSQTPHPPSQTPTHPPLTTLGGWNSGKVHWKNKIGILWWWNGSSTPFIFGALHKFQFFQISIFWKCTRPSSGPLTGLLVALFLIFPRGVTCTIESNPPPHLRSYRRSVMFVCKACGVATGDQSKRWCRRCRPFTHKHQETCL